MAAWLSCSDAGVSMQLTGMSPSAVSMCSLYPRQPVLWPFEFRLVPMSQAFGSSAAISSADIPSISCRSSLVGSFTGSSPFRGRPGLRLAFFSGSGSGFGFAFPRAPVAVESLDICPTTVSEYAAVTSASCMRSGSRLSANQAKARENTGSPGISDTRDQPQRRRRTGSRSRRPGQGARGRQVPHRLRDEGPRDRVAVGGRAPDAAVAVMHEPFHGHQVDDGDELPVRFVQGADLLAGKGKSSP